MYGGGCWEVSTSLCVRTMKVCMYSTEYACLYEVRKKGEREERERAVICRFTRRVTAACGDTSERMGEACIYGYDHRSPGNNYSTYNTITIEEKSTLPLTHHFLPPAKTPIHPPSRLKPLTSPTASFPHLTHSTTKLAYISYRHASPGTPHHSATGDTHARPSAKNETNSHLRAE